MRKKKTRVILISGKAQHGKDTTAQYIRDRLTQDGRPTFIMHFADLLKYICKQYFGWNGQKDREGRTLLQYIGTDVIRARDHDFWVDFVTRFLSCMEGHWDFVIIPDTRFPNEVEGFAKAKFPHYHLRVIRPNFDSILSGKQKLHPSETALDETPPDFIIYNHGTLDTLRETIDRWTEEHLLCKKKRNAATKATGCSKSQREN